MGGPTELKVEITRSCPLSCLHCSSSGNPQATEQLDSRRILELISEFAYLGGNKLCISGGEPLFHDGLATIVNGARKYGVQTDICTTGIYPNAGHLTAMPKTVAALLSEANAKLAFSLHGADHESHDRLTRVPGSFEATTAAITTAIEAGIQTEIHIVPTALNFTQLVTMAGLAASLGVNRVSWLRFVPQGRGWANARLLLLPRERLAGLPVVKAAIATRYPTLELRTGAPFNILCPETPEPCAAAANELVICPDGRILPCEAFKGLIVDDEFGSILDHSLPEVWLSSKFLNQVRQLRASQNPWACRLCRSYGSCRSGCLAQKAALAGRLISVKDPDCLLQYVGVQGGEHQTVMVP